MLGLVDLRQLVERLHLGQRQHAVGLAAQPLDDALDHRLAIARRLLDLALAAHAALARGRQLALGLLQRLVGLGQPRLADRQPVGRLLAVVLRLGDLPAQRHALGLDLGGLGGSSAMDAAICSRRASSSTIWPSASASRLLQPA